MPDNKTLHEEVVRGLVEIIRYLNQNQGSRSLGDLWKVCEKNKSEDAADYVFEAVKDGWWLTEDLMAKVLAGDYSRLWEMTNSYLQHFGHEPVEPFAITV